MRSSGSSDGPSELVARYLERLARIASEIDRQAIERSVDLLFETWRGDRTIYVMGNGGSASTASHFSADLAKATIVPGKARVRVLSLTDNMPLVSAWTNDSGFASVFVEQLRPWLHAGDLVVALSVHGGSGSGEAGPWSQNLVQAVSLARERGARVLGMSGFGGGALRQLADVCIVVPIDQEPLGTPLVESVEVAVHHLLCLALKARIASYDDSRA